MALAVRGRQRRADGHAAAKERHCERQVVEHEEKDLSALPGNAVAVERQSVDDRVRDGRAQGEPGARQRQELVERAAPPDEAQVGPTRAEAEQRQADDEESEVVVLRDREQPGERAFEQQGRGGQRSHCQERPAIPPPTPQPPPYQGRGALVSPSPRRRGGQGGEVFSASEPRGQAYAATARP